MIVAFVATASAQDTVEAANGRWRCFSFQIWHKAPKLATIMAEAERAVLAYMSFDESLRTSLRSINPPERNNQKIKRRTNVAGDFLSRAV